MVVFCRDIVLPHIMHYFAGLGTLSQLAFISAEVELV